MASRLLNRKGSSAQRDKNAAWRTRAKQLWCLVFAISNDAFCHKDHSTWQFPERLIGGNVNSMCHRVALPLCTAAAVGKMCSAVVQLVAPYLQQASMLAPTSNKLAVLCCWFLTSQQSLCGDCIYPSMIRPVAAQVV